MSVEPMFFTGWQTLLRTLVVGALAYIALVIMLRISGRRTLAKMNAFDFVVTVALGSVLATILLSQTVALADGVLAFALLIVLQYAVTWSSVRAKWVRQLVTGEPVLLVHRGTMLRSAMCRARTNEDEVRAAVRAEGVGSLDEVAALVLETDGSFSVIQRSGAGDGSSMEGVKVFEGDERPNASGAPIMMT